MSHRVICFGEVLWDILRSGAVPGGAPMNVAYHLDKQGKAPALITRIGNDEHGEELKNIFAMHGVCTDLFQTDHQYETGKVYAQPNKDNDMVYDIVKPVAWDFISMDDEYKTHVSKADYFVFGSLAARSETSKQTLFRLLDVAQKKVLDINLRSPHFDRENIEELLKRTDILKLNESELELITNWFGYNGSMDERVQKIRDAFSIELVIVTLGKDGAALYMDDEVYRHDGFKVQVADTIGSGDAFLAGLLSKLMDNVKPVDALDYACALGAFIASRTGACPHYSLEDVERLRNK